MDAIGKKFTELKRKPVRAPNMKHKTQAYECNNIILFKPVEIGI